MTLRLRKTGSRFLVSALLCLGLLPACGGSDGSSTPLLSGDSGGGVTPGPGVVPGTGGATAQFGSARFDGAIATAVDSTGNVYVAGNTWGTIDAAHPNPDPSAATSDLFIVKYDRSGALQWIRQVGTAFDDFATGIAVDGQDNVVLTGYTFGNLFGANKAGSNTTSDFFLYKVSPAGNQLLAIQEGTPDNDGAWGVATDRSSNIYLAGESRGNILGTVNTGDFDAFVASYTGSGSLRWGGARKVGPAPLVGLALNNRDASRSLVCDEVRGILYVAGDFWIPADQIGGRRAVGIFVEKLDPATGNQVAWNPVNGNPFVFLRADDEEAPQLDFATGIALDREGSIFVSGYEVANDNSGSSNAGDVSHLLFKLDSSSNLVWHTYVMGGGQGPSGTHPGIRGNGLVVDSMQDVYLVGYASAAMDNSVHLGETDAFVMQFDGGTGSTLWTRQFGTSGYDRAFGVALDRNRPDPRIYVAGETDGSLDGRANGGGYDGFLVQYDMFGNRR